MRNGSFLALVSVENTKLWKRLSTKIMVLILIALTVGICGIYKSAQSIIENQQSKTSQSTTSSMDWKQQLKVTDVGLQQQIDTMEKSTVQSEKTTLDSTKMQLAENKYRIDHNMKPEKKAGFWANMLSSTSTTFLVLLAIIACSGLVAGEFSDGTMKTMISRPFARWQILSAKLIVIMIYALILTVVFFVTQFVSIAAFFGTGGIGSSMLVWVGGNVLNVAGFAGYLMVYGLAFLTTVVYLILAFALSAIFRSRALATGLSIFLMIGGSFTTLLSYNFSWGKYIFFADADFGSYIIAGAPFYGITLGLALFICAIYSAVFLFTGYFTFAKRDIS